MKVSIVVPLYNEEESLGELVGAIAASLQGASLTPYEIILVDDGSTDGSFTRCKELQERNAHTVKVIAFSRNYGKAAALSTGIAQAKGEYIVTMDADLQDDPVAIPGMIELLDNGWDLVSGWKKRRHDPISKTFPSKLWNLFTAAASGLRLHDFNCGFKAYRNLAAKSIEIYGERHRYLPVLAHWEGFRVTEMIVPHHQRKYGKSKYGVMRFFNGFLDIITLLFLRKYLRNPLHFFGLLGILLGTTGTGVLAYFGFQWVITGQMHIRPLVLLSVGAVIMGIQFISIGLIGEMIINSAPRKEYTIREKLL